MKYSKFMANMYHYLNNERKEISGFSKFEVQGDIVRIIMKLCFLKRDNGVIRIYLLSRKDGLIYAHKLKEDRMRQRIYTMQRAFDLNELKRFGINIDDIKGIYINFDNKKYFMSAFENEDINISDIRLSEVEENKNVIEIEADKETANEVTSEKTAAEPDGVIADEVSGEATAEVKSTEEYSEEKTAEVKSAEEYSADETAEAKSTEKYSGEKTAEVNTTEEVSEEISMNEITAENTTDNEIMDIRATGEDATEKSEPVDTMFEKTDLLILKKLPRRAWSICNNSFLLHGYYNYHHIAVKRETDKWIIGVPGMYHPTEAKIAAFFGFGSFSPEIDEEITNDTFGYWCMSVDISE